jgi:hypothetical protein
MTALAQASMARNRKLNGAETLPAAPSSRPRIGEYREYGGSKIMALAP